MSKAAARKVAFYEGTALVACFNATKATVGSGSRGWKVKNDREVKPTYIALDGTMPKSNGDEIAARVFLSFQSAHAGRLGFEVSDEFMDALKNLTDMDDEVTFDVPVGVKALRYRNGNRSVFENGEYAGKVANYEHEAFVLMGELDAEGIITNPDDDKKGKWTKKVKKLMKAHEVKVAKATPAAKVKPIVDGNAQIDSWLDDIADNA